MNSPKSDRTNMIIHHLGEREANQSKEGEDIDTFSFWEGILFLPASDFGILYNSLL